MYPLINYNCRLSNDGARHKFEFYLEKYILPVLVDCADVRI